MLSTSSFTHRGFALSRWKSLRLERSKNYCESFCSGAHLEGSLGPLRVCGPSMRTFTQRKGLWRRKLSERSRRGLWTLTQAQVSNAPAAHVVQGDTAEGAWQAYARSSRWKGGSQGYRAQTGRARRRMDRINHKAGKCLALPGFIPCVDGGSPRLEQVCTMLLLMLSQMLFSSGGQDSHPLRAWPTPAAWSIFSEWIKINTMMFTVNCVKTRLPGLGVKE